MTLLVLAFSLSVASGPGQHSIRDADYTIFHGIDFDPVRLRGILSSGVRPGSAVKGLGNEGRDFATFFATGRSWWFDSYVANGLGFVVDARTIPFPYSLGARNKWDQTGHVRIEDGVGPDLIRGLIVPSAALTKSLAEVHYGFSNRHYRAGRIATRARVLADELADASGFHETGEVLANADTAERVETTSNLDPKQLMAIGSNWPRDAQRKSLGPAEERILHSRAALERAVAQFVEGAYAHLLGLKRPTVSDLLRHELPRELPTYDSEGFPLQR